MTKQETKAFLAQFGIARRSFKRWPLWMQRAARYASANLKTAASNHE